MELQIPNTGDGTHKATRQELSQIIAFLDAKLPVTLTVHFQVLTQLRSENPAYSAYFMRRSDGQYSAIMAVNEDVREYANQRLQVRFSFSITDGMWKKMVWFVTAILVDIGMVCRPRIPAETVQFHQRFRLAKGRVPHLRFQLV